MSAIKTLTTLIFDLDGTLCRYQSNIEEGLLDTFELENIEDLPLTLEDYKEGFDIEFEKAIGGEVTRPEMEFRARIFWNKLKDQGYEEEEILSLGRRFTRIRESSLSLYEDVPEVFSKLSEKFKLGLLTNGPSSLQRSKIDVLEIEDWFDEIIVSGEHYLAKPDPRIFYIAMNQLNCTPEESIYIGNSLKYDVRGSNNAGIPVIWKKNGQEKEIEDETIKPNMVIDELKELFSSERTTTISEEEKRSIKS